MFNKALVRLTVLYSLLFFILFWSFGLGFYLFLHQSFGQNYFNQVKNRLSTENVSPDVINQVDIVVTKAVEVTLEQTRYSLVIVNGTLLLIIPLVSWVLAYRTLLPIFRTHTQQRQFVSDVSHELRTPLTFMLADVDLTLKKKRSSSLYEKALKEIRSSLVQMNNLISGFLALTRYEDVGKVAMTETDLNDVASEAMASQVKNFKQQKIKYKISFPKEPIVVWGNQPMLKELITVILDNAIKYSRSGTTVGLTIKREGKYGTVAVRDQGIGIPKDKLKNIFDRFYRGDPSRGEVQGYGLGLSIAKNIVIKHKGDIKVTSTPGKGSLFTVSIPLMMNLNRPGAG